MKMFKKLLAVALAGVLALSVLTACSGNGSSKSFVDALNEAGSVKFTTDSDMQNATFSAANIAALENAINTVAKADPSKSKDTVVADVLAFNLADEHLDEQTSTPADGAVTVTGDDPVLYAVVWNADVLSATTQAKNAINGAKSVTLTGYTVKNSEVDTSVTPTYTSASVQLNNATGYLVAAAKLHTDLGTCTLVAFVENT